jgi:hypothetical protein
MRCLNCGSTNFKEETTTLQVEDGDKYEIEGSVCQDCSEVIMTTEQMNQFREAMQKSAVTPS